MDKRPPKAEATGSNPVGCAKFPSLPTNVPRQEPCSFEQDEARTNDESAYIARTSYVYFVACEGHVKIGVTKDVKRRIRGLQSGSPFPLDLIGLVEGDAKTEAEYHKRFRKLRVGGEWFALAPPLTDEIMRLVRIDMGLPGEGDLALCLMQRLNADAPKPGPSQEIWLNG